MNKKELQAIEEYVNKATEGPWEAEIAYDQDCWMSCTPDGCPGHENGTSYLYGPENVNDETIIMSDEDAEFCAKARTDMPKLIEEIKRLNRIIENQ